MFLAPANMGSELRCAVDDEGALVGAEVRVRVGAGGHRRRGLPGPDERRVVPGDASAQRAVGAAGGGAVAPLQPAVPRDRVGRAPVAGGLHGAQEFLGPSRGQLSFHALYRHFKARCFKRLVVLTVRKPLSRKEIPLGFAQKFNEIFHFSPGKSKAVSLEGNLANSVSIEFAC